MHSQQCQGEAFAALTADQDFTLLLGNDCWAVHTLQLCCKTQPKLRKKAALLARDIAVVCIGLRTAIMIDYMPLTAAAMLAILVKAEIQAATLQQAQCNVFQAIHVVFGACIMLAMCMQLATQEYNAELCMAICNSLLTAATAAHLLHVIKRWDSTK